MDILRLCGAVITFAALVILVFAIDGYFFMFLMWTVGFNVPFWKCVWCTVVMGLFNHFAKKMLGA